MIGNQTGSHSRRVLRTEIDSSSIKKSKKLTQRRTEPKPMKKERKKRMKKVPEQEPIFLTETIPSNMNCRKDVFEHSV